LEIGVVTWATNKVGLARSRGALMKI